MTIRLKQVIALGSNARSTGKWQSVVAIATASFVLALLLLLAPPSVGCALAAESGTAGNCTWELDDEGTLTIAPMEGTDGVMTSFNSADDVPWSPLRLSIVSVEFKPGVSIRDAAYMFSESIYLESVVGFDAVDASATSDMGRMFYNCSSLESLDLSGWDTSKVANMVRMFEGCSSLESLDLSGWDTSKVANMVRMFEGCSSLESLDLSWWDTSSVESMYCMFNNCSSLESLDLSGWDVSRVKDMEYMFDGCTALESLDVSGWDTSSVESMNCMFQDCRSLESLDLSGWDTSKVADMVSMFSGCSSLKSLDLSSWNSLSGGAKNSMFYNCTSLKELKLGGSFTLSSSTFLRRIHEPGFWQAVGEGTVANPSGKRFSSVSELSTVHNVTGSTETYVAIDPVDKPVAQGSITYNGEIRYGVEQEAGYVLTGCYFARDAGDYVAVASLEDGYIWSDGTYDDVSIEWSIYPISIPSAEADIYETEYEYDGLAKEPFVWVYYRNYYLTEGVDYELSYADNISAGIATVTITGKGSCTGSRTLNFEILPAPTSVTRLSEDVYQTAAGTSAVISSTSFDESEWVVLARDDDFADAMSATGLAGALDCPIVLTDRRGLSAAARAEIDRLGATSAYVIGGTGAMPGDFEGELERMDFSSVERIWGNESWDTSVECAKRIIEHGGSAETSIVAMSLSFQDALSISSFAYRYEVPIYLQTQSGDRPLPDAAIRMIKDAGGEIYVPGGPGAVRESTVEGVFGADRVIRLWGYDGYDTSNQIATYMVKNGLLSADVATIACGAEAAKGSDALSGAALAGRAGGVVLLANANERMEPTRLATVKGRDSQGDPAFLSAYADRISQAYVLGGTYVMPEELVQKIGDILA